MSDNDLPWLSQLSSKTLVPPLLRQLELSTFSVFCVLPTRESWWTVDFSIRVGNGGFTVACNYAGPSLEGWLLWEWLGAPCLMLPVEMCAPSVTGSLSHLHIKHCWNIYSFTLSPTRKLEHASHSWGGRHRQKMSWKAFKAHRSLCKPTLTFEKLIRALSFVTTKGMCALWRVIISNKEKF